MKTKFGPNFDNTFMQKCLELYKEKHCSTRKTVILYITVIENYNIVFVNVYCKL